MIYIILLFGFILRLVSINQSFWLDEATSAILARDFTFSEIISKFSPGDFHPPFYYLILKAWTIYFGVNEISTRMLSVFFGLGTVYLVYKMGSLFSKSIGWVAALLMATAPLHIYYSQEARMYAAETFFVALSVFSFMKILKTDRVGYWILFSISLALVGATDYLPLLIIPVFWAFGLLEKKETSWWFKFIASHIFLVIVGFIWWQVFWQQLSFGTAIATTAPAWWNILGRFGFKELALVPVKFMIGRIAFEKLLYATIVTVFSLVFGYLLFKSIRPEKNLKLVWLWLVLPIAFTVLISFKIPVFSYFRLLFVLPAVYLLLGSGIVSLKVKFFMPVLSFVFLGNLFFSGIYLFTPKFHREDWRTLVNFVENEKKNKRAITLFPAGSQMEAYKFYFSDARIGGPDKFTSEFDEIWLIRYVQDIFDPEDTLRKRIEEKEYIKRKEWNFNGVVVWHYIKE